MCVNFGTFSGITPVPSGQADYRQWYKAAVRLTKDAEVTDTEIVYRIQSSLMKPALDIVQNALDAGSPTLVLQLLDSVYGNVEDPRDLFNAYNNAVQDAKERASDYLSRLFLLLDELHRRDIIKVEDGPTQLLKQFVYGCTDDNLVLKLRLEEKESDPPDYGKMLLAIRVEEAKRTRRQVVSKLARSQQVSVEDSEIEKLKKEISILKGDKQKSELQNLREEVAQLKQQNVSGNGQGQVQPRHSQPHGLAGASRSSPGTRPRLRFCFKCGLDGHTVWNCKNVANPQLVCKRFEVAKETRAQENR